MKTVWLSLTSDQLILYKTSLGSSKEHARVHLGETEFVDVSLGHIVEAGSDEITEVGAKEGEACFVVSYSDPKSETGGGRFELYSSGKREAEEWTNNIMSCWHKLHPMSPSPR